MTELGFIGLGVMGGRITERLLDAGYPVTGYNRTKSKAQWLLEKGLKWADSPRELTEKVDIVFSMVTNFFHEGGWLSCVVRFSHDSLLIVLQFFRCLIW